MVLLFLVAPERTIKLISEKCFYLIHGVVCEHSVGARDEVCTIEVLISLLYVTSGLTRCSLVHTSRWEVVVWRVLMRAFEDEMLGQWSDKVKRAVYRNEMSRG